MEKCIDTSLYYGTSCFILKQMLVLQEVFSKEHALLILKRLENRRPFLIRDKPMKCLLQYDNIFVFTPSGESTLKENGTLH